MAVDAEAAPVTVDTGARTPAPARKRKGRRGALLSPKDRWVRRAMILVPTALSLAFIWFPTVASIWLSFRRWDGIGSPLDSQFVGLTNYRNIFNRLTYPPFWPALQHNAIWLLVFLVIATPIGLLLAVLLDRELKGSRVYQSSLYLPVVLSLALVGFIWDKLIYAPEQGLINNVLGRTQPDNVINWLGEKPLNLVAVLIAASWRHVGYIMILYLAGLKAVDPSLREAAAIDGASEWQTFRKVIFPTLRPINIVILVVTVSEALRAFDLVYVINKGRNGLELLSVLVTDNIIGEASIIGRGSALATVLFLLCVGFIVVYIWNTFREREG